MKDESDEMRDEYDFSNAVQGKFYRPIETHKIPFYLVDYYRQQRVIRSSPDWAFGRSLGLFLAQVPKTTDAFVR